MFSPRVLELLIIPRDQEDSLFSSMSLMYRTERNILEICCFLNTKRVPDRIMLVCIIYVIYLGRAFAINWYVGHLPDKSTLDCG